VEGKFSEGRSSAVEDAHRRDDQDRTKHELERRGRDQAQTEERTGHEDVTGGGAVGVRGVRLAGNGGVRAGSGGVHAAHDARSHQLR
jgi:hypothetical protein